MVDSMDYQMYAPEDSRMIWIDCEMTGLDIFHDELCEVSVVPTDFNLRVLDAGFDVVIRPSQVAEAHMNDFVRSMHTRSGLIDEWHASGVSVEEAQQRVVEYVARFLPKAGAGKALLAGNSVGSDKKFLDKFMPELMERLHYRVIDVSTIKELARRWYPDTYAHRPAKHGGHRALADIVESMEELRFYRDLLFAPMPGPSAEQAAAEAARVEADTQALLKSFDEAQGAAGNAGNADSVEAGAGSASSTPQL